MDVATQIREKGFRKWYERQLIESHLAFTTCFLCGIVIASCVEAISVAKFGWESASLLALVLGATLLGWLSWRRYITVFERAEAYANHSTCPACKTYGRFEILASGHAAEGPYLDPAATPLPYPWLRVKCRQCGSAWRMPE